MGLELLGRGGSGKDDCPAVYFDTDDDTVFVLVGWQTARADTIEIPHLLLGFVPTHKYVATRLADTGRGTFLVSGRPVMSPATLAILDMEDYEAAIVVPKKERTYFGGVPQDARPAEPVSN